MKKLYLAVIISMGTTACALADGTVTFSNFPLPGYITFGAASPSFSSPTNTAPVGSYEVELLFASGSSASQTQSAFTLIDTYIPVTGSSNGPGFFDGGTVTISSSLYGGGAGGAGVFEIEGLGLGQYSDYSGLSAEFVNSMGNPAFGPNGPPTPQSNLTGWNGALILETPEPCIMALAGLGAAAMLLYRRKK